jgi:hypothetical protein
MQVSAELRWWFDTDVDDLEEWFCKSIHHGCPAGGGKTRMDKYLRDPSQIELGLKHRDGKAGVEVKGLVAPAWGHIAVDPFSGSIELWAKWTSEQLELPPKLLIATTKVRWLRKFDTENFVPEEIELDDMEKPVDKERPLPSQGCNVELTQVRVENDKAWWSLSFEAFGAMERLERNVEAIAKVLASREPPRLDKGILASYPAWLSGHAKLPAGHLTEVHKPISF